MATRDEGRRTRRRKAAENEGTDSPVRKLRSRLTRGETRRAGRLAPLENTLPGREEEGRSRYFQGDPAPPPLPPSGDATVTKETVPSNTTINKEAAPSNISQTPDKEDDIFSQILASKRRINFPNVARAVFPLAERSYNITHSLNIAAMGNRFRSTHKQSLYSPVTDMLSKMELCKTERHFDRRVTAMEWHPTLPNLVAIGSKGGDIILMDINESKTCAKFITGRGPGGNVSGIKFNPNDPTQIYTSALDGKLLLQDFSSKTVQTFLDTMTWDFWYCSVDIQGKSNIISTGDNVGNVLLLSTTGEKIFNNRLHKNKVTHVEFSPRDEWMLISASTDQTVKIWDRRMMKDRKSALQVLQHDKPVNSAYFNLKDGTRLLTTDQHHELRIYQSGSWTLERTIEHPHRFFQHITPIKAYWHPLEDLIVVGRYPDEKIECSGPGDRRAVDIYCADTGERVCQMIDPAAKGITPVNKFNNQGDVLVSGMGFDILVWRRREEAAKIQEEHMAKIRENRMTSAQGRAGQGQGTSGQGQGRAKPNKQRKPAARQKQPETKQLKTKVTTKTKK